MLRKEKGTKQDTALDSPESNATNGAETDEAIPADEEEVSAYDHQIQQIFELASECQVMAEELYPLPEDCSTEMYLAILKIQADCHMELFRAIVNNAANMVSAMQMLAAQQVPAPPGIIMAQPPAGHGGRVVMVHPPGEGL